MSLHYKLGREDTAHFWTAIVDNVGNEVGSISGVFDGFRASVHVFALPDVMVTIKATGKTKDECVQKIQILSDKTVGVFSTA